MSYINQQASQLLVQVKTSENPNKARNPIKPKNPSGLAFLKNGFSELWLVFYVVIFLPQSVIMFNLLHCLTQFMSVVSQMTELQYLAATFACMQ